MSIRPEKNSAPTIYYDYSRTGDLKYIFHAWLGMTVRLYHANNNIAINIHINIFNLSDFSFRIDIMYNNNNCFMALQPRITQLSRWSQKGGAYWNRYNVIWE